MEHKPDRTPLFRTVTRYLSIAAALVFIICGTLITRDDLYGGVFQAAAPEDGGSAARSTMFYSAAPANGAAKTMGAAYSDYDADYAVAETADAGIYTSMTNPDATDKKIIRNASLTLQTQTYDDSLDALRAATESTGGWIEAFSEYTTGSGLRRASLSLRVPQEQLDGYLAATESLGRVTSRSESSTDVTASYQDTQAQLATQQALMARLQALITESADLSDLLALESQIADTQYRIDSLQRSLNNTDRQVTYSTVSVSLQEETAPALTDDTVGFGERILSAVQQGFSALVSFLGDAVIFLVAALPFIAVVAAIVIAIRIIRRFRRK